MDYISKFHFESLHQVLFIIRNLSIELNDDRVYFLYILNNLDVIAFYDYACDLMGSFGFLPHYRAVTSREIWGSGYFAWIRSLHVKHARKWTLAQIPRDFNALYNTKFQSFRCSISISILSWTLCTLFSTWGTIKLRPCC